MLRVIGRLREAGLVTYLNSVAAAPVVSITDLPAPIKALLNQSSFPATGAIPNKLEISSASTPKLAFI